MAVVVRAPWTKQRWALPFLCVLATTPEVSAKLGIRHKTLGMRAHHVVSLVRRWLPGVPIKLLGDRAYRILELGLHCTRQQVTLIAPFRLDSMIHQPTPVRDPHTVGRPRVVGERLPSLEQVLSDPANGVGAPDSGVIWRRATDAGMVYRHGLLVSIWLHTFAHSLPSSLAIQRANDHPKPSFPLIRHSRPRRSSAIV